MVSVAFTDVCEDGTAACRHLSDKPHLLQIRNDTRERRRSPTSHVLPTFRW